MGNWPAPSPQASATCTLTEAGLPVAEAVAQISFRFAADDDQFLTIAKLGGRATLGARRGGGGGR